MSRIIRQIKDLYVFDLDMTLVNTIFETGIYPSVVATLNELKGSNPGLEMVRDWWYMKYDFYAFIRERFGIDDNVFLSVFRRHDTPEFRAQHTVVFPGVISALQRLQAERKKLAIITYAKPNIAVMEAELLLGVAFDKVLSLNGNPDFSGMEKPHPGGMYHVLEELRVPKERAVYSGDSESDGYFAHNAEVDFIHFNERQANLDLPASPLAVYDHWDKFYNLETQVS